MRIKEEIDNIRKLVIEEGYLTEMVVSYMVDKKIYHSVAVLILKDVFNYSLDYAEEIIYEHEFYAPFKNEINPFSQNIDYNINLDNTDNEE